MNQYQRVQFESKLSELQKEAVVLGFKLVKEPLKSAELELIRQRQEAEAFRELQEHEKYLKERLADLKTTAREELEELKDPDGNIDIEIEYIRQWRPDAAAALEETRQMLIATCPKPEGIIQDFSAWVVETIEFNQELSLVLFDHDTEGDATLCDLEKIFAKRMRRKQDEMCPYSFVEECAALFN